MSAKKKSTPKAPKVEALTGSNAVGHYAIIKPEISTFVGGDGIPALARTNEVFVRRVNDNGTMVVAYVDSCAEIGTLFASDLITTEQTWQTKDDIEISEEESVLDIRIFGVPERMEIIQKNKERLQLPDDRIFIDENHEGLIPTAKRAWSHPTDKPHVLVLQDDVELSDNFKYYANIVASTCGDAIVSLFPLQFLRRLSMNRLPKTPYVETKELSGAAIIMPAEWIEDCLSSWADSRRGDDVNILAWANNNNKKIIATLPALVQHIGIKSVFDPSRSIGGTDFWRKDPSPYDWKNPYITPWSNISR